MEQQCVIFIPSQRTDKVKKQLSVLISEAQGKISKLLKESRKQLKSRGWVLNVDRLEIINDNLASMKSDFSLIKSIETWGIPEEDIKYLAQIEKEIDMEYKYSDHALFENK